MVYSIIVAVFAISGASPMLTSDILHIFTLADKGLVCWYIFLFSLLLLCSKLLQTHASGSFRAFSIPYETN
ncbi:hypothetical protein F5Y19DRAFT_458840 [Xylariaceae sp. FL1651]|nr:hypothetical protein F5Y19DRAFT_458840 [Xylariaceae sp. FL1651]